MRSQPAQPRGFTLVEVIVSIVLLGILGGVVAVFIRAPMQGYVDMSARAELADQADLALRRMARDVRLALPNSIRTSANGSAVEFLLTKAGGRYLAADDGVPGSVLDFVGNGTTFSVVGPMPSLSQRIASGDYVVVYNLGPNILPADAYQANAGNQRNIARVTGFTRVGADLDTITLADNPFSLQDPPLPSPQHRFQLVSGPVSYVCATDADGSLSLWRYAGYPITAAHNVPPVGGSRALVAKRLDTCTNLFRYDNIAAAKRTGLVLISLALRQRNDPAAVVRLVHQVHVDNTP